MNTSHMSLEPDVIAEFLFETVKYFSDPLSDKLGYSYSEVFCFLLQVLVDSLNDPDSGADVRKVTNSISE